MGEMDAVVYATGVNTFFGKAANLVATTETHVRNLFPFLFYECCIPLITFFFFWCVGPLPRCVEEHWSLLHLLYRRLCSLGAYHSVPCSSKVLHWSFLACVTPPTFFSLSYVTQQ